MKVRPIPQNKTVRISGNVRKAWFREECYDLDIQLIWSVRKPMTRHQMSDYLKATFNIDYPRDKPEPIAQCLELMPPRLQRRVVLIAIYEPWQVSAGMISALAHEAFHATEIITSNRGVKTAPNKCSEAHAYLLDSIVRRCLILLGVK